MAAGMILLWYVLRDICGNWKGRCRAWCTGVRTHSDTPWDEVVYHRCLGSFAGILVTYFFVPDMTEVDLADEDARFMGYLEINGWEGVVGEDEDRDLIEREPSTDSGSAISTSVTSTVPSVHGTPTAVRTRVSGESLDK
ncbi:hypothetical protein EDB92DRAFT_124555 [Lactarius akahatsu]|uniref:Uncharacterized protein n=1 Tax=Lactarius akahatsu TaxID=416441 RepID=A0AAD4LBT8_9AGAM|nr:hypothetical protein EDB92DRAFT_124555 [Lactarius akahatsu]